MDGRIERMMTVLQESRWWHGCLMLNSIKTTTVFLCGQQAGFGCRHGILVDRKSHTSDRTGAFGRLCSQAAASWCAREEEWGTAE